MRVLVIEDDSAVASFIVKGLREASYAVDLVPDGDAGFKSACENAHDLIILDLMLPGRDGFSIIRGLRERDVKTPILCLTAKDTVDDRVMGLNLGADDYLTKPFSFSELLARLRALCRRGQALATNTTVVGDLVVDSLARSVTRSGQRIDLSAREYSLLEYLAKNAGHVLTRTMILQRIWDMHQDPLTNVVDVHINRLRKKVDYGFDKPLIHTTRSVGYVLRES